MDRAAQRRVDNKVLQVYERLFGRRRTTTKLSVVLLLFAISFTALRRRLSPKNNSNLVSRASRMSSKRNKMPSIPGFFALTDQILVREADTTAVAEPSHPSTIILYGWGDGLPRHLAKFADGYRVLYPGARQVVVLSPIAKTLSADLEGRTADMRPVVSAAFPSSSEQDLSSSPSSFLESRRALHNDSVLVQVMSNTGAISYAATLNAYRAIFDAPMPHRLLILDSTPGSTTLTLPNLGRWSRAMALGTAGWFPWPFVVTQVLWGIFLCLQNGAEKLSGRTSAPVWTERAVNDTRFVKTDIRRLFLYSKTDDLISWEDIEAYQVKGKELGYDFDAEIFEGSGHVGHMKAHPEQYWKAVADSWRKTVQEEK